MRRSLHTAVLLFCMAVLYSCQKEVSYEVGQPAAGSLQSDAGDCLPKTLHGTFKSGQAAGDTNYLEVTVNFTQAGPYTIYTDTVNGYHFRGTGSVSATGPATIRLNASGTPVDAGTDDFFVIFDTSICAITVDVLSSGSSSGGTAAFTLSGAGGNCSNSNVTGTYTQGTALTNANQVAVEVTVTTVGTWTMSTNSVAGFSFSGSGTFTTPGTQTVVLNATGTPSTAGSQAFSVSAGTGNCTFNVTVAPGTTPPPVVGDHFILTNNSWVSYSSPISQGDTLKRTIVGSANANGGFVYKIVKEKNTLTGPQAFDDSLFVRKSGNNYYELNYVDTYTSFYFDNEVVDSILFLKEGLATGNTWSSPEYSDAVSGVPTKLRYDFKCDDANASVTYNGKTYTNVYKITMKAMVNENNTGYQLDMTMTNYYAAGIGWIYQKYDDGAGFTFELPVRFYQVF